MSDSVLRPVAILRTPFAEKFGVPRQSGLVPAAEGRVEFLPEFAAPEFTRGLEAFSHVWLITGFHQNPPWTGSAVVRPPRLGGNARVGVFASRSPNRPNGLGLSLVRILAIDPGVVRVAGVDADWANAAPPAGDPAGILIPAEIAEQLGAATAELLRQVLRLDVGPAYHDDPARTYGMTLAGWNIRWRQGTGEALEVYAAEPV